jgi:hypothetical protein
VIATFTGTGVLLGRRLREHHETLREPFGVLQAAILGIVGLILAFGLTLAVGRYEDRRAAVVSDANAIGTTYLRAQLLAEPVRSRSLVLLHSTPSSPSNVPRCRAAANARTIAAEDVVQRRLWSLPEGDRRCADRVRAAALRGRAEHDDRRADGALSALNNRVPGRCSRSRCSAPRRARSARPPSLRARPRPLPMLIAAALVTVLLLVTFDLARPTRGLITVPDTAYRSLLASMSLPPAASHH